MALLCRNNIPRAERNAEALTPEEINKRTADRARERKENWTKEELEETQAKRNSYYHRVANPVRRFKAKAKQQGMLKSEMDRKVKAFQKLERQAMKDDRPSTNPDDTMSL